jgi:septal ring-binding cell division protein DamX
MCKGKTCKAWVKRQPLAEKYEYTIELNEYNCIEMKYKTLRITKYDSPRNIMRSITPEEQGWNYIVPESVSRELYDFVCKNAPNHKEQLNTNEKDEQQEVETKSTTMGGKKEISLEPQKPSEEAVFTVQVGAFKNSSYAEYLMAYLKKKGYSVYITLSGSKEGEKLYKVCIGKFIEREKAKILSEKIKNSEGIQTFVISLQL